MKRKLEEAERPQIPKVEGPSMMQPQVYPSQFPQQYPVQQHPQNLTIQIQQLPLQQTQYPGQFPAVPQTPPIEQPKPKPLGSVCHSCFSQ